MTATLTFRSSNQASFAYPPDSYTYRISAVAGTNSDITQTFDVIVTTSCTVDVSEFNWLVPLYETKEFIRRFYDTNWSFSSDPDIEVAPIDVSLVPWFSSLATNPTCSVQAPVKISCRRTIYDENGQTELVDLVLVDETVIADVVTELSNQVAGYS